jgi:hypothetical protein
MNLQMLLGDVPQSEFLEQYFHHLPFSSAATAAPVCECGSWEILGEILQQPNSDRMVVRAGQQYAGPLPSTLAAARALMDEGYTVLVRHAERHHPALRQLAEAFYGDLQAPVDIHLYATPAGGHGFGWHYDAEDVFIMQTVGTKAYSLRKNTVHPWPLVETIPQDMNYSREIMPLLRVALNAGDWLYIPCGYWHKAEAPADPSTSGSRAITADAEPSISLSLGVMSPAAISVYDFLRPQLVQSLLWRQRLPLHRTNDGEDGGSIDSEFSDLFGRLANDLASMLRDPKTCAEFCARVKRPQ